MVTSFKDFVNTNNNKTIYIPGYATAECVAPFWKFNTEFKGEKYSAPGACNLWTNYTHWDSYERITGTLRYGDWVIWSGFFGAYPNNGSGHICMYLEDAEQGYAWFQSQNPGPFIRRKLSLFGVMGALRAKGVPVGNGPVPVNPVPVNRVLSGNAYVRRGPSTVHPLAPGYGVALAKGTVIAVTGYVVGQKVGGMATWVKTKSGFYIHAGNVSGGVSGLVRV